MRDEFIRFRNYKNRVALRFRVRCVSAFSLQSPYSKIPNRSSANQNASFHGIPDRGKYISLNWSRIPDPMKYQNPAEFQIQVAVIEK